MNAPFDGSGVFFEGDGWDFNELVGVRPPDAIIATGYESWEGATHLHLYYTTRGTVVLPEGEVQNGDAWLLPAIPLRWTPEEALREYRESMENTR